MSVNQTTEERKEKWLEFLSILIFVGIITCTVAIFVRLFIWAREHKQPSESIEAFTDAELNEAYVQGEKVLIKMARWQYYGGKVKVFGVAANAGSVDLYSPVILLEVYDETGKVKLGEQRGQPVGWQGKNIKPGEQAAFMITVEPTGAPKRACLKLSAEGYPFEVIKYEMSE